MDKETFLSECEKYLGPQHPGKTIGYNRWRRGAGSGRFANGIIRWYNASCIHIMFSCTNYVAKSPQEALDKIKDIKCLEKRNSVLLI